jgi:hypothetical protein
MPPATPCTVPISEGATMAKRMLSEVKHSVPRIFLEFSENFFFYL